MRGVYGWHLLVFICCLTACNRGGHITPTYIDIHGYYLQTTHHPIDLRLDGEPVVMKEAVFTLRSGRGGEFALTPAPLAEGAMVTFNPYAPYAGAEFQLLYRGVSYVIEVSAESGPAPSCPDSGDECRPNRFNPDTEVCVPALANGDRCEVADCAHTGVCVEGRCILREPTTTFPLPVCSFDALVQNVEPTWSLDVPPGRQLEGPLTMDEAGNGYFFEFVGTVRGDMVSVAPDGRLRWQTSLGWGRDESPANLEVRLSTNQIFVYNRKGGRLRALRREDGARVWGQLALNVLQLRPVGSELWVLVELPEGAGRELRVLDGATGELIRTQILPDAPAGETYQVEDFIAGADGPVFVVGESRGPDMAWTVFSAVDPVTGAVLWSNREWLWTYQSETIPEIAALAGTTMILTNGTAYDVQSREVLLKPGQDAVFIFDDRLLTLQSDSTGYSESLYQWLDCPFQQLQRVTVRMRQDDWMCILGTNLTETGGTASYATGKRGRALEGDRGECPSSIVARHRCPGTRAVQRYSHARLPRARVTAGGRAGTASTRVGGGRGRRKTAAGGVRHPRIADEIVRRGHIDGAAAGADSENGSRFTERILTTVAIVRRRRGNFLRSLTDACAASRSPRAAPSRLSVAVQEPGCLPVFSSLPFVRIGQPVQPLAHQLPFAR